MSGIKHFNCLTFDLMVQTLTPGSLESCFQINTPYDLIMFFGHTMFINHDIIVTNIIHNLIIISKYNKLNFHIFIILTFILLI